MTIKVTETAGNGKVFKVLEIDCSYDKTTKKTYMYATFDVYSLERTVPGQIEAHEALSMFFKQRSKWKRVE